MVGENGEGMTHEYENTRRVIYGAEDDCAQYVPVCPTCGRYVKADDNIVINGLGEPLKQPNATCAKCGRVSMPFEGFGEVETIEGE